MRQPQRYIEHHYQDHSQDVASSQEGCIATVRSFKSVATLSTEVSSSAKKRGRDCLESVPFPVKLHRLLENVELDGLAHIISWQTHGRAFQIHKSKEFLEKVMPGYFRQTKIASFRRQLNLYGFLRITQGRDKGAYYHELFLRGMGFLAEKIMRQRVKGTFIKGKASPETEPDFYSMQFLMAPSCSSTEVPLTAKTYSFFENFPQAEQNDSPLPNIPLKNVKGSCNSMSSAFPKVKNVVNVQDEWDLDTFSCDDSTSSIKMFETSFFF
jgi:hypothetical protein